MASTEIFGSDPTPTENKTTLPVTKESEKQKTKGSLQSLNSEIKGNKDVIHDKYLKENGYLDYVPFINNIKGKLEKADKWGEDKLSKEIYDIEIKSEPLKKENWDKFIDDLIDWQSKEDLLALENEIKKFADSDLYKDAAWNWKYENVSPNIPWIKGFLKNSYEGVKDTFNAVVSSVDIQSIWIELDRNTREIIHSNPPYTIEIKWNSYKFNTKKEALKFIYKMKLIFKEVAYDPIRILSFSPFGFEIFKWFSLWDLKNILSNIVSVLWSLLYWGWIIWWITFAAAGPISAWIRNTQDAVIKNLWNVWQNFFNWLWEKTANFHKGFKWEKGDLFWRSRYILSSITKIISIWWKWFATKENTYIPINIKNQKINIIDGLSSNIGNSDVYEWEKRAKVLDYFKKKWRHDPIRVEQFDRLKTVSGYLFWWQIVSWTDTFWKNIKKINDWVVVFKNGLEFSMEWLKELKPSWEKGKNLLIAGKRTRSFLNENKLVDEVNEWVENQRKAWDVIYKIKKDWEKIETIEKKDFLKHIEWYIDYESSIDPIYEKSRRERITKYIEGVQSMDVFWVTPESIKQDIMLISDWFLTKYESMDLLLKKLNETTNKDNIEVLKDIIEKVRKWELIFKNELGELDTLLSKSSLTESDFTDINNKKTYNNTEIEARKLRWEELIGQKFNLSKITDEKEFYNHFEEERKIWRLLDNSFDERHIRTELSKLYEDIKESNDGISKVRYLNKEINYIVDEIIHKKSFYEWLKDSIYDTEKDEKYNNEKYSNKNRLIQSNTDKLIKQINKEIKVIERIIDIEEKEKKFENLKKKYNITFENSEIKLWELWKIIWEDSSRDIETEINIINNDIKNANGGFIEVDKDWKLIKDSLSEKLIKNANKQLWDSHSVIFWELEEKIEIHYKNKQWKIKYSKLKQIVDYIIKNELKNLPENFNFKDFNESNNWKTQKSPDNSEKREEPKTEQKDSSKTEWSKTEWTEKPKDSISEKWNKIISLFDKKNSFSYDDLRKKIVQIKNNLNKLEKIENNWNNIELSKEIKNLRTILESFKNINVFIEIHSDSYIENIKLKDLMSKNTLESVYKTMKDIMGYDISIFWKTTKRLEKKEKVETPQKFIEVDKNWELVWKSKKLIDIAWKNYPRSNVELTKLEIEIKKYYQWGKIKWEISFSKLGRIVNLVVSGMIKIENNFDFSKEYKFNNGIREDIKEYKWLRREKVTSKKWEIKVEFTDSDNVTFEELVKEWNKVKDTLKEWNKTPKEIEKINRIRWFFEAYSRPWINTIDINEWVLKWIWKEMKEFKK